MSEFIEGESRYQATLFPEKLDGFVSEDNSVRVIDVFVDKLDISGLGFKIDLIVLGAQAITPVPCLDYTYTANSTEFNHPGCLERESQRNLELMYF